MKSGISNIVGFINNNNNKTEKSFTSDLLLTQHDDIINDLYLKIFVKETSVRKEKESK